jgi:mannosyltransferase
MTLRGGSAAMTGVLADPPAVAVAAPAGQDRDSGSGQPWLWLLPAVVTGIVVAIGITTPSYWRDEAATMAAVHRPAGDLVRMLGNVDAVHGAYYLLVWPLARLFGSGELVMRLPSLLAMAIAAGAITATGRRLATPAVGLIAGIVFAAAPSVTEFGQMARSYALVTMAAAIASYALVRALADAGRARRWVWYAVSVAVLGALNIAALLLVPAHGITVWLLRRDRTAAGPRPGRSWLIAAAIGSGLNVPLVLLAFSQRGQVKWLPPASVADLGNALDQLGPPLMTVAIAVTALTAVAVTVSVRRRAGPVHLSRAHLSRAHSGGQPGPGPRSRTGAGPVAALCMPWLAVPPVALLLLSALITPLYNQRYIMFCMPAAALMTGVALAALARVPGPRLLARLAPVTALAVVIAFGLGLQVEYRQPAGHADNIRAADAIISAEARPGDVMMYTWPVFMPISTAYPDGLARLPDIQVDHAAILSGTLAGTTAPRAAIRARIGRARRLWIIQVSVRTPETRLLTGLRMRLASTWQTSDIWLQLYVHDAPGHRGPAR